MTLKQLRMDRGYTQEGLARRAHVTTVLISKWERGLVRHPKSETVKRVAAALGCGWVDLIHWIIEEANRNGESN